MATLPAYSPLLILDGSHPSVLFGSAHCLSSAHRTQNNTMFLNTGSVLYKNMIVAPPISDKEQSQSLVLFFKFNLLFSNGFNAAHLTERIGIIGMTW